MNKEKLSKEQLELRCLDLCNDLFIYENSSSKESLKEKIIRFIIKQRDEAFINGLKYR